jgi:hypothetical protein
MWECVNCVSSDISAQCQIHTMTMDNGVMKMRRVEDGLEIKPGGLARDVDGSETRAETGRHGARPRHQLGDVEKRLAPAAQHYGHKDATIQHPGRAGDRIELLATKSLHKLLRVHWLLKAIDVKPLAVVKKRMASRAKRQVSTKPVYLVVAVAFAQPRR